LYQEHKLTVRSAHFEQQNPFFPLDQQKLNCEVLATERNCVRFWR